MKKNLFTIICSMIICLSMIVSISAERTLPLIVDEAELLTEQQEESITAKLDEIIATYQTEVAILTVNDLAGSTAQALADDFYDYYGYGYGENDDGILVLYKPGEAGDRKLHVTTHGTSIDVFTDSDIDYILSEMKYLLIEEDYEGAFNRFVSICEDELADEFGPPSVDLFLIPLSLLIAFVIAFIIAKVQASKLKSVRRKVGATNYVREGSMVLTSQHDIFLYRTVSSRVIENNNNNSSTHTSSSGRTHGGGGTSF